MLQLSLFWIFLGVIFGLLAQGARLGFSARGVSGANGWLATLATGIRGSRIAAAEAVRYE